MAVVARLVAGEVAEETCFDLGFVAAETLTPRELARRHAIALAIPPVTPGVMMELEIGTIVASQSTIGAHGTKESFEAEAFAEEVGMVAVVPAGIWSSFSHVFQGIFYATEVLFPTVPVPCEQIRIFF